MTVKYLAKNFNRLVHSITYLDNALIQTERHFQNVNSSNGWATSLESNDDHIVDFGYNTPTLMSDAITRMTQDNWSYDEESKSLIIIEGGQYV